MMKRVACGETDAIQGGKVGVGEYELLADLLSAGCIGLLIGIIHPADHTPYCQHCNDNDNFADQLFH
ncbi:MAG: hypothetical protein A2075_09280 [Geobacteraceae bacterium GWC2_58_44]|nr:MAG: hypothetical protein A2075_09280 [Geobacteraceae bacterium GWC2_58_44]HBG07705.1 hypothetical protein [Geobacter sp.]